MNISGVVFPKRALCRILFYNQPMESFLGKSRVTRLARSGVIAAILAVSSTRQGKNALGQSQTPAQYPPTQYPPTNGYPATAGQNPHAPFGQEPDANQDPTFRHSQQEAAKKRNIARQNKLVANSSRIVQLANELSTGVEPKGSDQASAAMLKKAEEIEKLAKSVKELMKSE